MTAPIKRALHALDAYSKSPDIAAKIYQLLKDIHHLADIENLDWNDLLDRVNEAFKVETSRPLIRIVIKNTQI